MRATVAITVMFVLARAALASCGWQETYCNDTGVTTCYVYRVEEPH